MEAPLLLALTAGMLGAVNPCGFALLPAYLSVLVAAPGNGRGTRTAAVARALRCTAALTLGYVAVFGVFGLALLPLAGRLMPRLPWLTVVFGAVLAGGGLLLLAGRSLPLPAGWVRAPRLTGTASSMVAFGCAYAVASLGCAVGPFLALVVGSLRAGSVGAGVAMFVSYAAGMGLVVGVTAVAVALLRHSVVSRLRRATALVPRVGGLVLTVTGAYVAYYGAYELRLVKDGGISGHDPVVNLASAAQAELSGLVGRLGAGTFVCAFAAMGLGVVVAAALRRRTSVGS